MQTYKKDNIFFEISDTDTLDSFYESIKSKAKPGAKWLVLVPNDGAKPIEIDLSSYTEVRLYTLTDFSFRYVGRFLNGVGASLLSTVLSIFNRESSQAAKLAAIAKGRRKQLNVKAYNEAIAKFEESVPPDMKLFYDRVMHDLEATIAYKVVIIEQLTTQCVKVTPDTWRSVLPWFRDNVLSNNDAIRQPSSLRNALVTALVNACRRGIGSSSPLGFAKDNSFDWTAYAKNKGQG